MDWRSQGHGSDKGTRLAQCEGLSLKLHCTPGFRVLAVTEEGGDLFPAIYSSCQVSHSAFYSVRTLAVVLSRVTKFKPLEVHGADFNNCIVLSWAFWEVMG